MTQIKYPRTFHLPQSPGVTSDDKVLKSPNCFVGKQVVITEKMDGENTTMYTDGFHARSIDSRNHPSRNWLAKFHSEVGYQIPTNFRICGENMYAQHSIHYRNLPSYFLGFSVWCTDDKSNWALSWDETIEWFELLGIEPVPVLYRGAFNVQIVDNLIANLDTSRQEGFVIRVADEFDYNNFDTSVAKWVRAKHVTTDEHWMHTAIVPNHMIGM